MVQYLTSLSNKEFQSPDQRIICQSFNSVPEKKTSTPFRSSTIGVGEIARWIKCYPYMPEDNSLDLQKLHKMLVIWNTSIPIARRELKTGEAPEQKKSNGQKATSLSLDT